MQSTRPIRRALISVSDKTGIIPFARSLSELGVELISTGGTASLLKKDGISVITVSEYTGFPEIMDGRLKTIHPKVYGGILGRRGFDDSVMLEHQIIGIDIVIVNLYPFTYTIACKDCTREKAIENIDIGGPAMVRAAAKNYQDVAVIVNCADYLAVIAEMNQHGGSLTLQTRFSLSIKAFEYTSAYDSAIANYFKSEVQSYHNISQYSSNRFPDTLNLNFIKKQDMRYGENSHQQAALYVGLNTPKASVVAAQQLQGKLLSYNNIVDADSALECVKMFTGATCVIVKHSNPCGVATGNTLLEAYERAYQTDPTSAFGGIIAFNQKLKADIVKTIISRQFVEVIIAPFFDDEALVALSYKKNIRVLAYGDLYQDKKLIGLDFKGVNGGLLVQDQDVSMVELQEDLQVVTKRQPTEREIRDSIFCWKVAKFVKSNAVVYALNQSTLGIGAGQMSRVYSARIAGIKASDENLNIRGSVMASDAFFPFRDGIDAAASVGVFCIIQPGGSIRDHEVISAADEHGIAMIFTHKRHFRH